MKALELLTDSNFCGVTVKHEHGYSFGCCGRHMLDLIPTGEPGTFTMINFIEQPGQPLMLFPDIVLGDVENMSHSEVLKRASEHPNEAAAHISINKYPSNAEWVIFHAPSLMPKASLSIIGDELKWLGDDGTDGVFCTCCNKVTHNHKGSAWKNHARNIEVIKQIVI